jgi:hypothetical protein
MGVTITESQGVMAVSTPQTDYNTGVTPSSVTPNFRQIVASAYVEPPDFQSPNVGNQGEATGSPYSTKTSKGRDDASGSFSVNLTFEELGFWAYRSFGVYETPVLLATGVYKHVFKLLNPHVSREIPAWMLALKLNEAALSANEVYNHKYRGCKVETAEFITPHSAEKPYLQGNISWHGSGKQETGDVQFFGAGKHVLGTGAGELDEKKISENGTMNIYSAASKGGTPYAMGCDFYHFRAAINENLNTDIGYSGCPQFQTANDPNSGMLRSSLPVTEQMAEVVFSAKLTPELKAAANFETLRKAGTELSADWTFLGQLIDATYNRKAMFSLNKFTIGNLAYPTIDSVRGIEITTQPEAISSTMPLELELVSHVPTFATFVG